MSLSVVGIDGTQEKVYRALVARPDASPAMLAIELDLPEPTVDAALVVIADRGLASRCPNGTGRYVPAPPAVALGAIVTEHRDELRQVDQVLAELAELYRRAGESRAIHDALEVVTGVEAIRHRFLQIQSAATEEVLAFISGVPVAVAYSENTARMRTGARGIPYRRVIDRSQLDDPATARDLAASVLAGDEVRITDTLPMKLTIVDRSVALIALRLEEIPSAVLVHESKLLDGLIHYWARTWQMARPLRLGDDGLEEDDAEMAIAAIDAKILGLLLAGLTDQAVASQLGTSERTIQRHVKQMMDLAGVRTRMQLGWHASRHGWV